VYNFSGVLNCFSSSVSYNIILVSGGVVAVPLSIVVIGDGLLKEIRRDEASDRNVVISFVLIAVILLVVVRVYSNVCTGGSCCYYCFLSSSLYALLLNVI
jgi:hypothetical protein